MLMWKQIAIAMACLVCLGGCEKSHEMETAPVEGMVTVDGTPLSAGMVYFVPGSGRGAKGEIQQDGSYRLGTYEKEDGAIVGFHKVFILAVDAGMDDFESTAPTKSLVPRRYTNPETSGIEIEIKAGEMNEVPLELTR